MTYGVEPPTFNIPHTIIPAPCPLTAPDSAPVSAPYSTLINLPLFPLLPVLSSYTVLSTPAWPGETILTSVLGHTEYYTMNTAQ